MTRSSRSRTSPRQLIIGGQRRQVARHARRGQAGGLLDVAHAGLGAFGASNQKLPAGTFASANREFLLETGEFLRAADEVRDVVVGVANGRPVFVRDVAEVSDGAEEPSQYVRIRLGQGLLPGGHDRHRQAQGHQRHRRRRHVLHR